MPCPKALHCWLKKDYDSKTIGISSRSNRKPRFAFPSWTYHYQNLVERFFDCINHFIDSATRSDKCPEDDLVAVKRICVRIWFAAQ